jgi:tetratricopeptide (TPR) repeat protein
MGRGGSSRQNEVVEYKTKSQRSGFKLSPNSAREFDLGFSGAPVCYEHDWKVVGIFEATDDNKGYIIPMNTVIAKFELENVTKISSPAGILNTQKIMRLGNEFYDKKEFRKAIENYQAILNDPNYVYALINMGSSLHRLGRNEEAIKYLDRAIELNPNDAYAWLNKANALDDLRRHEEAIPCFDRAIELNPNDAYAWTNKSESLYRLGKYEEQLYIMTKH